MTPEQAQALREPFPESAIGKLPKAGLELDFVGHANVTDRLLSVDPAWGWEPVAFTADGAPLIVNEGKRLVMWIRLTVCGVTRLGVGTCAPNAFEPEKELVGDALRNSAMRFGVALDLWARGELESQQPDPWWVSAGWRSEAEHDECRDELRQRSRRLPEPQQTMMRDWLKAEKINPMALTIAQNDAWASELDDMEQT